MHYRGGVGVVVGLALASCSSSSPPVGDTGGNGGGAGGMGGGAGNPGGSTSGPGGANGGGMPFNGAIETTAATCGPAGFAQTWAMATPESAWTNVDLTPAGGMQAIRDQLERLRNEDLDKPVRLRLAPGTYATRDAGQGEVYLMGLLRKASAPVLIQATDPAPNATRLGQGFNLVAVSYLGFDGLTFGPATVGAFQKKGPCDVAGNCSHAEPKPLVAQAGIHISGTAVSPGTSGLRDGHLDYSIYGRYEPAHHIVIRRVTIQNVFDDAEESGRLAEGGGSDGIKFNQAAEVWVVESSVRQVSRHGIDEVGVHGGCYLGNSVSQTGQGLAIEAKGGAVDVTYDGNVFYDVRRVEIGGELTDATYYWSAETPGAPEHYNYEGRRVVARNNFVIDAREGAFEFSGCHDCAVIGNTVLFTPGFDRSSGGGDVIREVDSQVNRDGAGAGCTPLDGDEVEKCWGVGPYPTDLVTTPGENGVSRIFTNARNSLVNNLFLSPAGLWGADLNPYNHPNATHSFGLATVDYNYWWDGGHAMTDPGDGSWLRHGPHSVYTGAAAPDPGLAGLAVDVASLMASARAQLRPGAGSPVTGKGLASAPGYAARDAAGATRPEAPALGAMEP
jgi:hypothetical protein